MKTFLTYISEGGKTKKARRYKGTPAVVDTHGSHAQDKARRYKGTPVIVNTHGSHAQGESPEKKRVDEKVEHSTDRVRHQEYELLGDWADSNDNKHLGRYKWDIDAHLHKGYPHDHFSKEHKLAVNRYTEHSRQLNHHLLEQYKAGVEPGDTFQKHNITHLDDVLNDRPLRHDLHVYSGVEFHPGEEAAKDPERKLHLPAYTSTSTNKSVAFGFTKGHADKDGNMHNHVLHIHLKPGQKGNYFGERAALGNEYEFLLPRNTTLKIHPEPSVLPEGAHHANPHPTFIWHAHVVPNEEVDPRQIPMDFGKRKS